MTQNLPILYQNILSGLPSRIAQDAFLWATERPGEDRMCYRAERFGREVSNLVDALTPMLDASARIHGMTAHDPSLMDFMLARHANWRFGGNVHPSYSVGA